MIANGIVHCHSELSYDCRTPLEALRDLFTRQGLQFAAMTDHDRGLTPDGFRDFVGRCAALSDERFVFVPGIEVRCAGGAEIAGVGLSELPEPGEPEAVVRRVRELGGYAIWVHPRKRAKAIGHVIDCDALEVLNGKLDGVFAPDLGLVRLVRQERARGRKTHAMFGLDMHDDLQPRCVWTQCEVPTLEPGAIVESFRRGRFVNRTRWGTVASSGEVGLSDLVRLSSLRWATRAWDGLLRRLPEGPRQAVVRASRPAVGRLKSRAR